MAFDHVLRDEDKWLRFTNKPKPIKGYTKEIPPGPYKVGHNPMAGTSWLEDYPVKTEGLIEMPDPVAIQILGFIRKFFTEETKRRYDRYNILYRAGVLLHGVPGTGKTYTIHRVIEEATKVGYITLRDPDPRLVQKFVQDIREITENPEFPILVIWEEFDALLERGLETNILALLDGTQTQTHVVYLATTNYIKKIPDRIKARPSRFNLVLEAKAPGADQRHVFFTHKLHADDQTQWVEKMVEASEGLVLDFCKELILGVLVYDRDLKIEVNRLREMAGLPTLELEGKASEVVQEPEEPDDEPDDDIEDDDDDFDDDDGDDDLES